MPLALSLIFGILTAILSLAALIMYGHREQMARLEKATEEERAAQRRKFVIFYLLFLSSVGATAAKVYESTVTRGKERQSEVRLSRMSNDLQTARNQLSTFDEKLKARKVTPQQRKVIMAELAKLPSLADLGKISVGFPVGLGEEATIYGNQIAAVLKDAGFTVGRSVVPLALFPGLTIEAHDKTNRLAVSLQEAFATAGVRLEGRVDPRLRPDQIHIGIGMKPD